MNKDDMIKYLAIAGGAYLVYWYITSYGPDGAVNSSTGALTGHLSYWQTWFGSGQTAAQAAQTQPMPPGTQVVSQPVLTQPSAPAPMPPVQATPPPNVAGIKQQIVAASAGNNQISAGYATPDVWSYYWQQVTGRPISSAQLSAAFPPGPNGVGAQSTIDQWLSAMYSKGGLSGIGDIVSVPNIPSLPSMTFGGSLRRPNLQGIRGMGGRGTTVN